MKNIIALLFALIVSGCAATPSIKDTQNLNQDEGVLVVGLGTNWKNDSIGRILLGNVGLVYLQYRGRNDSIWREFVHGDRTITFKGEKRMLVTTLPAQEYYFVKAGVGSAYADLKQDTAFAIKTGEITYIGNIYIEIDQKIFSTSGHIDVTDDWENTQKYLQEQYPTMSSGMKVNQSIVTIEYAN